MNPLLAELREYPLLALEERRAKVRASGRPLYDFGVGDPREPTPGLVREALRAAVPEVSSYPSSNGTRELREACAGWVRRRFGVSIDAEREVLPCAGAKEAVFHLPLAVLDPRGDKRVVVWGDPGYPVYARGALFAGGESYPVRLTAEDGYRLRLDRVPRGVLERTALVWVNYPHNPTGAVVDVAYYRALLEAAERYGFVVASDEPYVDLYFDAAPPSLLSAGKRRALAVHSLSKRSGMTGYRSGFMAGDAEIVAALRVLRPSIGVASPEFVYPAAAAAWRDDEHVEERRRVFAAKRKVLVDFFAGVGLGVAGSEAGLYVWSAAPRGMGAGDYALALLDEGIVVSPGTMFGEGEGWVRCALVPGVEECRAAVERWRVVLGGLADGGGVGSGVGSGGSGEVRSIK